MAVQVAASSVITLLDTYTPYIAQTSGEGGAAVMKTIEDQVAVPRTGFGTQYNFVRLCRFPASAKVKKVELYADVASGLVDGGTSSSALVLKVGVIFSDSTQDGTPAAYQNQQPTTVGVAANGGSTTAGTTVAINGTSANYIFGTNTASGTTGAFGSLVGTGNVATVGLWGAEVTYGGVGATYGSAWYITNTPLISIFNLLTGSGYTIENCGFFDLIVIASTIYNTQPAAGYNLYGRVSYVD